METADKMMGRLGCGGRNGSQNQGTGNKEFKEQDREPEIRWS